MRERVDEELFLALVMHIRAHGYVGKFYSRPMTYFEEDGMLYWTMGAPIEDTTIVNPVNSNSPLSRFAHAGDHQKDAAGDEDGAHGWMHTLTFRRGHSNRDPSRIDAMPFAMRNRHKQSGDAENDQDHSDDEKIPHRVILVPFLLLVPALNAPRPRPGQRRAGGGASRPRPGCRFAAPNREWRGWLAAR